MIRVGSRLLALAGGAFLGATLVPAPSYAATVLPLAAEATVTVDGAVTTSDVRWELPADAAPGDVVTLSLPEHAGAAAGADWIASTGAPIGVVRVDESGAAVIELNEAAADPANRRGEVVVRSVLEQAPPTRQTSTSTADATLSPGEEPGPFYGAPDRSRGSKYGAWTDETEARARWVLEAPRGPWDALDIADRPGTGQRVDCAAGVRVRATDQVEPATGYLIDPVDVPADRVVVSCDEEGVDVRVEPVGDEIVEVTLETVLDVPSTEVSNLAEFSAVRSFPGDTARTLFLEPRLSAAPVPTVPPVATTPEPGPELPARLAETGSDAAVPTAIGATLLLAGAAAAAVHRRRTGSRS